MTDAKSHDVSLGVIADVCCEVLPHKTRSLILYKLDLQQAECMERVRVIVDWNLGCHVDTYSKMCSPRGISPKRKLDIGLDWLIMTFGSQPRARNEDRQKSVLEV